MDAHLARYRDARERYLGTAMAALSGLKALRSRTNLTVTDADLIDRLIKATQRLDDAYTAARHHRPERRDQ